jgi:plastocyanin
VIEVGRVGWMVAALVPALAGCGGRSGAATPAPAPALVRVVIRDTAYSPPAVTVPAGGRVVWLFEDGGVPHTVTADANSFGSSPNGQTAGSFEHVFTQPGVFAYHCDVHPSMHGTVTVRPPVH